MKTLSASRRQSRRTPSTIPVPILVRGVGVQIPALLRATAVEKASKLLRRHRRVIRVRIDFELERARHCSEPAMASGRVEVRGSDLVARAEAATLASGLDRLVKKLDRLLRERAKQRVNRRNDRPAGVEFRDLMAAPSVPLSRIQQSLAQ